MSTGGVSGGGKGQVTKAWSCNLPLGQLSLSPPEELSRCSPHSRFPTKAVTMAHLQATCSNHGLTLSSNPEVLAGKGAPSDYLQPTVALLRELQSQSSPANIWRRPPVPGGEGWGTGCVCPDLHLGRSSLLGPALRSHGTRLCRHSLSPIPQKWRGAVSLHGSSGPSTSSTRRQALRHLLHS